MMLELIKAAYLAISGEVYDSNFQLPRPQILVVYRTSRGTQLKFKYTQAQGAVGFE